MSAPKALLMSRGDIAGLMGPADYLEAVETGFRAAAEGKAFAPAPLSLEGEGGAFHAKGATLRLHRPFAALKLNGNFPDNTGELPTVQGAILLCDGRTGALLAIMDSIEVTLRRTAAATALAARHLARADSETVAICGCGAQGAAQLEALAGVLDLKRCFAWDRDGDKAEAVARLASGLGMEGLAVEEFAEAALESDAIVVCTTARAPFLGPEHVAPGAFVAAVGADSPEKSEIRPALMAAARVVVDSLDQCLAMGDLRHAVLAGAMRKEDVHAELAAVVTGTAPGRRSADEIFVFDSTGTALQDVAAAALLYERACTQGEFATVALGR